MAAASKRGPGHVSKRDTDHYTSQDDTNDGLLESEDVQAMQRYGECTGVVHDSKRAQYNEVNVNMNRERNIE